MSTHGTLTAYAKRRGISQQAASQFKRAGRLVLDEVDGRLLVNFDASDAQMAATADPANVGRGANAPRGPRGASPGRPIQPIDPEVARIAAVHSVARARLMNYRAQAAELIYRQNIGELVPADEMQQLVFNAFRRLRDAVLRIPRRVAGQIPGASSVAEVEQILRAELDAAFAGFVDPIPALRSDSRKR